MDVELLINSGVNINYADEDGITALHMAGLIGHLEVVKILLDRGGYILTTRQKWKDGTVGCELKLDGTTRCRANIARARCRYSSTRQIWEDGSTRGQ
jgi:ankyrin repeat protein